MVKNRATARRIAADALFSALGLITFLIENLFPPLFIPGAKMGLSNIFSLSALVLYGPVDAFAVIVVRTVLGSLFAGNVAALMYSFTGGVVLRQDCITSGPLESVDTLMIRIAFQPISRRLCFQE